MKTIFTFQNKQIHYQDEGKGSVIVLIHGFLESLTMWAESVAYLQKHYRIIAVDLPGHGKSDLLNENGDLDNVADSIAYLLEQLGVKSCVCIGHSLGGYVTLALAERHPHLLRGLLLFHSHALADSPEAKINRGRAIKVVKENHQSFIAHFIPDLFTPENRELHKQRIAAMQDEARMMSKEAVIAALSGMRSRPDRTKLLAKSTIPVGFIIGHQDIRANIPALMEQVQMCPQAHLLMLKNVAHMGYIEDFYTTIGFLKGFSDQIFS